MDILGLEWGMELENDRNDMKQVENTENSRCYVYRMLKPFCSSAMVTNDSQRDSKPPCDEQFGLCECVIWLSGVSVWVIGSIEIQQTETITVSLSLFVSYSLSVSLLL